MRSVSIYYEGMFSNCRFELNGEVMFKKDITDSSEVFNCLKEFMMEDDFVCSAINVNNQMYANGDLIVIEVEDCDHIQVGLIKTCLVKKDKVFFVIKRYMAIRHWLRYFTCDKPSEVFEFVECSKIRDFKPLYKRGTSDHFIFLLHHHISFDYR